MVGKLKEFLSGINGKQVNAWKIFYADYYSPLCNYAFKILQDREQAMDVVQEAFVGLWESDLHFEDMPSFHGYLYKVVYNNCLKQIRDKNIHDRHLAAWKSEQEELQPDLFAAVLEEEIVRKLRHIIDSMGGKRKEVMLLCLESKKVEEISRILNISVNTVKKHKKEAYQYIREVFPTDMLVLFFLSAKS